MKMGTSKFSLESKSLFIKVNTCSSIRGPCILNPYPQLFPEPSYLVKLSFGEYFQDWYLLDRHLLTTFGSISIKSALAI